MITPIKTKTEFVNLHQIREPRTGTWTCNTCNTPATSIQVLNDPYDPNGQRKLTVPTEIIRNTSSEGEIIKINQVTAKTYKWMDVVDIAAYTNQNSNLGLESSWRTTMSNATYLYDLYEYYMPVILLFRRGPALTFTPTRTDQEMLLQLESYVTDGSLVELGTILSTPSTVTTANISESTDISSSFSLNSVPYYLNPGDAIYGYLKPFITPGSVYNRPSQAVCSLKINAQTYKDIIIN